VTYNVDSTNLTVGDSAHKVNDDDYHVISFVRTGTAGMLRIDSQLIQSLDAPGSCLLFHCTKTTSHTFFTVFLYKVTGEELGEIGVAH